ncbi:MAG: hypothetical protein RI554_00770, partial [Trueperaceae bacterium]|nr:hypothetical protein [Trueperaceae bacterium]
GATPLPPSDAHATFAGGCGAGCSSGGGGGGGGRDQSDDPVGRPYWVTTDQVRRSVDPGVATLIDYVTNYDGTPLTHRFSYRHRTVRDVGFSGGFADHFTAAIGGEVDRTVTRTLTKTVQPWHALKIYQRQETTRYRVSGAKYQDRADGSRTLLERRSGPYTASLTRLGYVTRALR